MAKEDRIIIEVEVNAGESAERLATIRARMERLKKETKDLRAEQKAINETWQQTGQLTNQQAQRLKEIAQAEATNTAQLKELTAQEKVYTAQVQIATQNDRKFGDSIIELGAQLAQLKQEYRSLSAEQRESDAGKALQKQIADLDAQVKQFDYSLGDHNRNVGNYTSALLGLNGNVAKVAALFQGGLTQGIKTASTAVKSFAKTLLTTPLGWILAGVAAVVKVFQQLRDAFKRNDEAGTTLQVALARFQPIVTAVRKVFEGLAKVVAGIVDGFTKAATAVLNLIPAYREASKAAQDLAKAQDDLQQRQRETAVAQAERNKKIAELNKQARSDEKLTAKEREEIYKQIDELSRQNMEDELANRQKEYDNYVQWMSEQRKLDDEALDEKNRLYIALIQAQTDYLNETTRAASRESQARQEQQKEAEAQRQAARQAAQQAAQERKARIKTQQDELRALEDLQIEAVKDEAQRARVEMQTAYNRRIEDLKKRLEEEKDLTVKAREAINAQIALLERQQAERLAQLDNERIEEQRNRANEIAKATIDARIAAIEDATEREIKAEEVSSQRKIDALGKRLQEEKDLTIEERANIEEQIAIATAASEKKIAEITAKARAEAVKKSFAEMQQEMDYELSRALQQAGDNALKIADAEIEAAQKAHDKILALDEDEKKVIYGSQAAYETARIESENRIAEARKKASDAFVAQVDDVKRVMQAMTSALSDLFEAAAGDTETYEKFKKAMAIVDATIGMATAIAQATAVSTEGDPYTMAIRIATNVAAVTAQFAALIKALKAAAIPAAPTFAQGGIVPGDSWTGDKVTARVNSGEMILTKEQQAKLFDLIQAGVPQSGIDYRLMARAVAEGVAALPAPVLDYSEFTRFERKVRQVERLTTL